MKKNLICILVIITIALTALYGCKPAEEAAEPETNQQPVIQAPSPEPSVTVEEDVIVPAHEPEPENETEEEAETAPPEISPEDLLKDHKESDRFSKGNPDVGKDITLVPRKVMIVFQWPLTDGTTITVWDKDETTRYDKGSTIIANEDAVVAFAYVKPLEPGIYKVKYSAVFAGHDEDYDGEGYYYFRLEE